MPRVRERDRNEDLSDRKHRPIRLTYAPLQRGDLEAVTRIESRAFSTPWPSESFDRLLRDPSVWATGAVADDRVIGYLIGIIHQRRFLIANLAVEETFRRRGVARGLIEGAEKEAARRSSSSLILDVRQSNLPALKLYLSLGFRIVGRRPKYYSKPVEDALVMQKALADREGRCAASAGREEG